MNSKHLLPSQIFVILESLRIVAVAHDDQSSLSCQSMRHDVRVKKPPIKNKVPLILARVAWPINTRFNNYINRVSAIQQKCF